VISVERGCLAKELLADDVVIEINGKQITGEDDYARATRDLKSGDDVVIRVLRREIGDGPKKYSSFITAFTVP